MGDFPDYTKQTAVATTWVSAGWATHHMVQLSLCQQYLKDAIHSFSTLASFLHVGQGGSGLVSIMYHSNLGGVLPSCHHNWHHASTHRVGASDALPLASAGGRGFLSSSDYNKISSFDASATRNDRIASKYTGNGSTFLVSIGFQPNYIKIMEAGSVGHVWDGFKGAAMVVKHQAASDHIFVNAVSYVATHANGFTAKASCCRSSIVYYFWASKEY